MLKKLKDYKMNKWMFQIKKIETWGHFYLIPTLVIGYTLDLNGYYSIELGWGKWFIALDIIPKTY